jgi:AcrR family transcriptional regulator
MPPTRTPRTSWIDAGLRALAEGGPDAVRVETLAETLGVTKGGFYWHFADRNALLSEMLDTWEQVMIDEVVQRVESEGGDARERLRRLFTLGRAGPAVASSLTAVAPRELLKIDLAIRNWARGDKTVGRRLKRVDTRRIDYLRSLFGQICQDEDEVEVRCLLVMTLFVGSAFIAADYGQSRRSQVLDLALTRLLT